MTGIRESGRGQWKSSLLGSAGYDESPPKENLGNETTIDSVANGTIQK